MNIFEKMDKDWEVMKQALEAVSIKLTNVDLSGKEEELALKEIEQDKKKEAIDWAEEAEQDQIRMDSQDSSFQG